MTRYEQETIIIFNEEEKTFEIETPNKALQRKIESYGEKPVIVTEFENVTFKTYNLPKKWLHIFRPRQPSEEERQKSRARALETFGRAK